MIVDYNYYENTFKGNLVPEEEFNKYSQIAENEVMLNILGKDYSEYEIQVKTAICEIIDIFYNQKLNKEKLQNLINGTDTIVSSEKVGDYSKNYSSVSINDLKSLISDENIKSDVLNSLSRNLLLTGLLYRGSCV